MLILQLKQISLLLNGEIASKIGTVVPDSLRTHFKFLLLRERFTGNKGIPRRV